MRLPPFMADSCEQMPVMVQLAARARVDRGLASLHDGADELVGEVRVGPAVAGALDEGGVRVLLIVDAMDRVRGDLFRAAAPKSGTSTLFASSKPEYSAGFSPASCSHSKESFVP